MKQPSRLAQEISEGLHEVLLFEQGKLNLRASEIQLPPPPANYSPDQVRELRERLGWSRAVFARTIGVSPESVRSWELGIRKPGGAAARLLEFLEQPELLTSLVSPRKSGGEKGSRRKLPG